MPTRQAQTPAVHRDRVPPSAHARAFGVLALVSAVAFVALALVISGGPLAIDQSIADLLKPLRDGSVGAVIAAVNLLGQALIWDPIVLVIAAVLWLRGRRFEAVILVGGLLAAEAGSSLAKLVVNRVRPPGVEVVDLITQASFPSGHMTRAVVTAGLLAWFVIRRPAAPSTATLAVIAAVAVSLVIGVARIAVGEHWFTDVVGAALFGVFALSVVGLAAPAVYRVIDSGDWRRWRG